jgi:small multidrug resistance pump
MAWLYLFLAIAFEVSGTTCMKASEGYTKLPQTLGTVAFYVASFTLLGFSLKTLDVGMAYAIWAGLGTVIIAIIGAAWFRESITLMQAGCIGLIIVGTVGLNFSRGASH